MKTINDYFANHAAYKYPVLPINPEHQKTIKEFYEAFIEPRLKEWYEDQHDNLVQWCDALEIYANGPMPIYWIRKFESGGKNVNDNRRGSVTVEVDSSKNAIAAYAYISNFDAQELYNMIRCDIDPCEFATLMKTGKYAFHYDKGTGSVESSLHAFPCLEHANSFGAMNKANLYLAHVVDVNGDYTPVAPYTFDPGDHITDWKTADEQKKDGYAFDALFTVEKLRVLSSYNGNVAELKAFLKAHFFRFVHPFNYFLVPGKNYEINAVYGKTKTGVGEDSHLINYVRYRMYKDFIQDDAVLADYYARFEDAIQISDEEKISKNFVNIEPKSLPLGDEVIHIVYGASVGEEGKEFNGLAEKVSNSKDVYEYCKDHYYNSNYFEIAVGSEPPVPYNPTSSKSAADLLSKINKKINSMLKNKPKSTKVTITIHTTPAAKAPKTTSKSTSVKKAGAAKASGTGKATRNYTEDEKLQVVWYYLTHKTGLLPAEKSIGIIGSGSTAQTWCEKFGIDTQKGSKHKGMFANSRDINCDLDTAIAAAAGEFKKTLEKIKAKGLHNATT